MSDDRHTGVEFEASAGNVFADLGFDSPVEESTKAELVLQIVRIVRERRLRQSEAAAVLGIPQSKASLLLRGRTAGFSTDRLLRFLNRLDQDVKIVVTARTSARDQARVAVVRGEASRRPSSPVSPVGRVRSTTTRRQLAPAAAKRQTVTGRTKTVIAAGRKAAAKRK